MKRRTLIAAVAAGAGLSALAWPLRKPSTAPSSKGIAMGQDIQIDGHIMSAPVAWRDKASGTWAFAVVVAQGVGAATRMQLDAFSLQGQRLAGFPRSTQGDAELAPGNQLFGGGGDAPPLYIDRSGRVRRLDGSAVGVPDLPAMALLASALAALPTSRGSALRQVLLAADLQPMIEGSRNAMAMVNERGQAMVGHPLAMRAEPEPQSALIDPQGRAAWVMLRSGAVDGMNLEDGRRPAGFPVAGPVGNRPDAGFRLAASANGQLLVVALGTSELWRIDVQSGQGRKIPVPRAQAITQVALAGGRLQALDEGTGQLLTLDDELRPVAALSLGRAADRALHSTALLPLPGADPGLLLLAVPQANETEMLRRLFEEKAPPAAKQEVLDMVTQRRRDLYGTRPLTAAEQADLDKDPPMLQRSWLNKHIGMDATSRAISVPTQCLVVVLRSKGGNWTLATQDRIDGATPDTGFRLAPSLMPAMVPAGKPAGSLLLPLNAADRRAGLVRIYALT